MGNGSSKPKPEAPKVVEPVNIMITKEVTERWAALSLKKLQEHEQQQQETKTTANDEKKSTPIPAPECLVPNLPQTQPMKRIEIETGDEKGLKLNDSSNLPGILPSSNKLSLSSSKIEDNPKEPEKTSMIESEPTSAPASSVKLEEIVQNYDDMDKFANFFVPKDSSKLRYDLENGKDIQDHLLDYETRYSVFLRKPNDDYFTSGSDSGQLYEDVDESRGIKRKHSDSDFFKEEGIIGENHAISGESSQPVKEIRVPKPALPVILDQDEEGKMTIETLQTWKLRERFEKEITKNNSYWTDELQRLTAKMEDEVRAQSEDLQVRIEDVNRKYAEVVDMPFKTGLHCNLLATHIGRCYEKNNDQVLKCNDLVRQFAKCTSKSV